MSKSCIELIYFIASNNISDVDYVRGMTNVRTLYIDLADLNSVEALVAKSDVTIR